MQIKIADRFRPYTHLPGSYVILPGSSIRLQIFPARILFDDLSGSKPNNQGIIDFDMRGPADGFTIQQDLEKGCIQVWGWATNGFFRYTLTTSKDGSGIILHVEKSPEQALHCSHKGLWREGTVVLKPMTTHVFGPSPSTTPFQMPSIDRLSLGNSKAQDFEMMWRRRDFTEIFPIWHRLGQLILPITGSSQSGTLFLLNECRQAIKHQLPDQILNYFQQLFLAGFEGVLSPRLEDTDRQGINLPNLGITDDSSLRLLKEGSDLIRSLFVQEEEEAIHLLPALPPNFHCGRLIDVNFSDKGKLSLEWTKKAVRKAIFVSSKTQILRLMGSKGEKSCRLRTSHIDKGIRYSLGTRIDVAAGQNYWFDNFER